VRVEEHAAGEAALSEALRKVAADAAWRVGAGERSRELTAGYTGEIWADRVTTLMTVVTASRLAAPLPS
jgi:hypothetical protein